MRHNACVTEPFAILLLSTTVALTDGRCDRTGRLSSKMLQATISPKPSSLLWLPGPYHGCHPQNYGPARVKQTLQIAVDDMRDGAALGS